MNNDDTDVRLVRGAVHIDDADPDERALIRNARDVVKHSAEVLAEPESTLTQARFCARELSRCLRDMLEIVDPQDD